MKTAYTFLAMLVIGSNSYAGLSGLGLGIHGGVISGYDNQVLDTSVVSQLPALDENILERFGITAGNSIDFDLAGDMTNIGAHVKIGTFRVIEFDMALDYAWKKQQIISGIDLTFSDFSVSGSVRKSFSMAALRPYIGAGLGMHWMAYKLDVEGEDIGIILPDNESKIGYHFKAGVDLDVPVFPITPYLEWKYSIVQTTEEATTYSSINIGLTLDLP